MSGPVELEDIIGTREAADIAGKSEEAIRKACQRGSLRAKHVGGRTWVTTRAELMEWLSWTPVQRRNKGTGRYMTGL